MQKTMLPLTTLDLLKEIKDKHGKNRHTLNVLYYNIWYDLNNLMVDRCIEDGIVELPIIGKISISRFKPRIKIKKNGFPNAPVNWGKTNKARKEGIIGKDKAIYSNTPTRLKVSWARPKIIGIRSYCFKPSRTNGVLSTSGFLNKIFDFLKENDTNYLKFPLKK